MQLVEWINTTLIKNGKLVSSRCNPKWLLKNASAQWDAIVNATIHLPLTASRAERIHCVLHGISAPVRCPVCHIRPVPFRKVGYAATCGERACVKVQSEHIPVAEPIKKDVRDKLLSKTWLKDQLASKGATAIAADLRVPVPVVLNYAIRFDLEVQQEAEQGVGKG
jgi:hypothetical protein